MASEDEAPSVQTAPVIGREVPERSVQADAWGAKAPPASSALRARFAALRIACPLPPKTGLAADKVFFDDLSGW